MRNFKRQPRHGDDQNEENSPHFSFARLDTETNSLTEEEVDEISLRIVNEMTRKKKDEIGESENIILEALNSLSENSLRDNHNGPSTEMLSDGENTTLVQPASHGLDSEQQIIGPKEFLTAHNQTFMTGFKSVQVGFVFFS